MEYHLLARSRSGVRVGVGVDIFTSRSRSLSRLKFVDSAALGRSVVGRCRTPLRTLGPVVGGVPAADLPLMSPPEHSPSDGARCALVALIWAAAAASHVVMKQFVGTAS